MAVIFFNYCTNMSLKRFASLQNKFFRRFMPFLLINSVKRINI